MKRKLFLLAAVLSLTFAISAGAGTGHPPMYIACETCMTTAPYPCECGPGTLHPGVLSDCGSWFGVCY